MTDPELASPDVTRRLRRYERARLALATLAALAAVAALAVSLLLFARLNDVAAGNRANIGSTAETTRVIRDCVDPGGECYRRSAERSAAVIRQLTDLQVAIELCGKRQTTVDGMHACIRKATEGSR